MWLRDHTWVWLDGHRTPDSGDDSSKKAIGMCLALARVTEVPMLQTIRPLFVAVAIMQCAATTAAGQTDSFARNAGTPDLQLDYATIARRQQIERLQLEYDSIHTAGPTAGIPISIAAMWSGYALLLAGALDFDLCFAEPCEDDPYTSGQRAMMGIGATIAIVGFSGLIASSFRLAKKKRHRRKLGREIAMLRATEFGYPP